MAKTNKLEGVDIKSIDELIALRADKDKMSAYKAESLKIKIEAEISAQVKAAKIKFIEAQEQFNEHALDEGVDRASLIRNMKQTQNDFEWYTEIYNAFFPNA